MVQCITPFFLGSFVFRLGTQIAFLIDGTVDTGPGIERVDQLGIGVLDHRRDDFLQRALFLALPIQLAPLSYGLIREINIDAARREMQFRAGFPQGFTEMAVLPNQDMGRPFKAPCQPPDINRIYVVCRLGNEYQWQAIAVLAMKSPDSYIL